MSLVAVAYLVLHGRFNVRPRNLAGMIAGFGFAGVYLLPFVKYRANPPAIGHSFTIHTRGALYLTMVASSLILLGLAVWLARMLAPRFGMVGAVVLAAVAFLVVYGVLIGLLPSLGNLAANVAHSDQFGYARAATETPQPITNILAVPLHINGKTIAPGQIVYRGFGADVLWKFRWYSLINQRDPKARPSRRPANRPEQRPSDRGAARTMTRTGGRREVPDDLAAFGSFFAVCSHPPGASSACGSLICGGRTSSAARCRCRSRCHRQVRRQADCQPFRACSRR
jgi:Probable cobalt transporter subunit (CbtA)